MFKLSMETANAAFADDAPDEIARILRELADKIAGYHDPCEKEWSRPLVDINGNTVGWAYYEKED